jgi:quercetin dioxygenase-like cupin family protein
MRWHVLVATILMLGVSPDPAAADAVHSQDYKRVQKLLSSDKTVLGQTIKYPEQLPAQITSLIVTLEPGESTGWHEHQVPSYGYVLEGEATIDYGSKGTRTYKAGEAFLEVMNWPHNAKCTSDVPVRILAVFMGGSGLKNVVRDEIKAPR